MLILSKLENSDSLTEENLADKITETFFHSNDFDQEKFKQDLAQKTNEIYDLVHNQRKTVFIQGFLGAILINSSEIGYILSQGYNDSVDDGSLKSLRNCIPDDLSQGLSNKKTTEIVPEDKIKLYIQSTFFLLLGTNNAFNFKDITTKEIDPKSYPYVMMNLHDTDFNFEAEDRISDALYGYIETKDAIKDLIKDFLDGKSQVHIGEIILSKKDIGNDRWQITFSVAGFGKQNFVFELSKTDENLEKVLHDKLEEIIDHIQLTEEFYSLSSHHLSDDVIFNNTPNHFVLKIRGETFQFKKSEVNDEDSILKIASYLFRFKALEKPNEEEDTSSSASRATKPLGVKRRKTEENSIPTEKPALNFSELHAQEDDLSVIPRIEIIPHSDYQEQKNTEAIHGIIHFINALEKANEAEDGRQSQEASFPYYYYDKKGRILYFYFKKNKICLGRAIINQYRSDKWKRNERNILRDQRTLQYSREDLKRLLTPEFFENEDQKKLMEVNLITQLLERVSDELFNQMQRSPKA